MIFFLQNGDNIFGEYIFFDYGYGCKLDKIWFEQISLG
jgi:hypothetical protein